MKKLLSGNEAIALGAQLAGVRYASAYPGTPSTEILENLSKCGDIRSEWAPKEKVALDSVAGASYGGGRALACMKHVGLNVASESLFYLAYTGVNAGLVIISADDPGAFSSQNEQDNRHYARFAKVPCLEPADSQECMDYICLAFGLSEQFDVPVIVRTTTRISHSKSVVDVPEGNGQRQDGLKQFPRDTVKYSMIPANARRRHPFVEERMKKLAGWADTAPVNRIEWGNKKFGIVSSSVAYQYAREIFAGYSFLKLGMSYPLPQNMLRNFASQVEKLVVVEELDPFYEHEIKAMGIPVVGKEYFPAVNEFSLSVVRDGARKLGVQVDESIVNPSGAAQVPTRPPALCPGCPHRSTFYSLRKLRLRVAGDIGCYSMGALPPFNVIDTLGCMGASFGVAHGVGAVGANTEKERWVAVIGDSTFFHAGMPALANVIYNRGASTLLILDNDTTAMTGQQENPGTGVTLQGQKVQKIDIESVVRGMGVKDVFVVNAFDEPQVEKTIKEALKIKDRPTVIISRGPCVFLDQYPEKFIYEVSDDKCNGCSMCFRVGCPAIFKGELDTTTKQPKALIDPLLCIGCDICAQVCPHDAIYKVSN